MTSSLTNDTLYAWALIAIWKIHFHVHCNDPEIKVPVGRILVARLALCSCSSLLKLVLHIHHCNPVPMTALLHHRPSVHIALWERDCGSDVTPYWHSWTTCDESENRQEWRSHCWYGTFFQVNSIESNARKWHWRCITFQESRPFYNLF